MRLRRMVPAAVSFLACLVISAPPAVAERVAKSRLDPMNYQYEGLEINGDGFADAVLINLVSGVKTYLLGDAGGRLSKSGIGKLTPAEREDLPDMVTEADVNGDKINDLIVVNLERLKKAASRDGRTFMRVLEYSIYFGQDASNFRTLRFSALAEEDRRIIEENAKALLLPPDGEDAGVSDLTFP